MKRDNEGPNAINAYPTPAATVILFFLLPLSLSLPVSQMKDSIKKRFKDFLTIFLINFLILEFGLPLENFHPILVFG